MARPVLALTLINALLAGLLLAGATEAQAQRQLCVLPIGDSITQGFDAQHESWRPSLWRQLVDARPSTEVLFTGSVVGRSQPDHAGHNFPQHHEGHSGWTSGQILRGLHDDGHAAGSLGDWMELYADVCPPTVVLVHLGTNDACIAGRGGPGAIAVAPMVVDNVREIITRVAARFPSVQPLSALVAAPIPSCCLEVGSVMAPAFRAAFAADSNLGLDASVNVSLVDMTTGYDQLWNYDGCHPDASGEEFMAARWFEQIQQHCADRVLSTCAASDINRDRSVGIADLLLLLSAFGRTQAGGEILEDVTRDGVVDVTDLLQLLSNYACVM